MVLEIAYTRRMQFEARVHAIATVELLAQALTGKSGRQGITKDGRVFLYQALRWTKVRGEVQKIGWRHTLEAMLRSGIPGITRSSLSRKFDVDMLKYPVGAPEEVHDALFQE